MKQDKINDVKKVTIKAEYPFGALDIESIELLPLDAIEPNLKPQKSDPTKVIRTTVLSDIAAIGKPNSIISEIKRYGKI